MSALAITGRELTVRVRSVAAARTVVAVVAVLGLMVVTTYRIATTARRGTTGVSALLSTGVGREVVHITLFVLLVVLSVAIPITAGAAIAGERDRGSLAPLLLSGVRPAAIVAAKTLTSVVSTVALVAVASPFLAVGYLLGGVTAAEVLRGIGMIVLSAWMLTAVSLACSASASTAATGIIRAGIAVLFLVLGTVLALGVESVVTRSTDFSGANRAVLMANPFAATADVVAGPSGGNERYPSPFTPFHALIGDRSTLLSDLFQQPTDGNGFVPRFNAGGMRLTSARSTPFSRGAIGVDLGLIVASMVVATRHLRLRAAVRRR